MTASNFLTLWLMQIVSSLPEIAACLAAGLLVILKWQHLPASAPWALLGYGFALGLACLTPLLHTLVDRWITEQHATAAQAGFAVTVSGFVWSSLRGLAYGLLATAVLTGRARRTPPNLPPRQT